MNNKQNDENELNNTSFESDNKDVTEFKDSKNQDFEKQENEPLITGGFSKEAPEETSFTTEQGQKSHKMPIWSIIALAAAILVLLSGSVYALANWKTIANTIALMTKSPFKYYTDIEKKSLNKTIDSFTDIYSQYIDSYKKRSESGLALNTNVKLTVNSQFASLIGLNDFQSVEAKISTLSKKNAGKASVGLFYNEQSLFNLDILINSETEDLYAKVPELSTSYIHYSLNDIMSDADGNYGNFAKEINNFLTNKAPSSEALNALLKKYGDIFVANVNNMVLDKDVKLSTSDISGSYNMLTAKFEQDDFVNTVKEILNTARNDEALKSLFISLGLCATDDEYASFIDNAFAKLNNGNLGFDNSDFIYMRVYVDKTGEIIGREFTNQESLSFDDQASGFGYFHLKKGKKHGIKIWEKQDGRNTLELDTDGSVSLKGFTGNSVLEILRFDDTYNDYSTSSIKIGLEDVNITKNGQINGKFTVTSDLLMGASLVLDCKYEENQTNAKLQFLYGGIDAASVEISRTKGTYTNFELPPSDGQIIDGGEDIYSYMQTADFEGLISHVEEITGLDLSSLLNALLSVLPS
ncbi:MAG: hypothetical protein ACFWTJ_01200 [Lachnoclostridium sp.]|jgi:hypothetical protein